MAVQRHQQTNKGPTARRAGNLALVALAPEQELATWLETLAHDSGDDADVARMMFPLLSTGVKSIHGNDKLMPCHLSFDTGQILLDVCHRGPKSLLKVLGLLSKKNTIGKITQDDLVEIVCHAFECATDDFGSDFFGALGLLAKQHTVSAVNAQKIIDTLFDLPEQRAKNFINYIRKFSTDVQKTFHNLGDERLSKLTDSVSFENFQQVKRHRQQFQNILNS